VTDFTLEYWIGLQRPSNEWIWSDGTPKGEHLPNITQQTNLSYKCSVIKWESGNKKHIDDRHKTLTHSAITDCNAVKSYICKKHPPLVIKPKVKAKTLLQLVGYNLTGLTECQGDCNSDSDCLGDLTCF
jgi:hypothetical protein